MPRQMCMTTFLFSILGFSLITGTYASEDTFKLEALRCPDKERGNLELVSRNAADIIEKVIAKFEGGRLTEVWLYGSEGGGPFALLFHGNHEGVREDSSNSALSANDMNEIFDGLSDKMVRALGKCKGG